MSLHSFLTIKSVSSRLAGHEALVKTYNGREQSSQQGWLRAHFDSEVPETLLLGGVTFALSKGMGHLDTYISPACQVASPRFFREQQHVRPEKLRPRGSSRSLAKCANSFSP
jgi:hypothetical protein